VADLWSIRVGSMTLNDPNPGFKVTVESSRSWYPPLFFHRGEREAV